MGEDATRPLGIIALPLHLTKVSFLLVLCLFFYTSRFCHSSFVLYCINSLTSSLLQGHHDCYKPNHHIFYADRVGDVADSIPKWVTLPEGSIFPQVLQPPL